MEIVRPRPAFTAAPRAVVVSVEPDFVFYRRGLGFPRAAHRLFLSRVHLGREGVLAGPVLGGPQVALLLEHLIAAGVREILFLGWAGALREELPLGSVLLVEGAESAEGTSRHYPAPPEQDPELAARVASWLRGAGVPVRPGRVVSTDALYRETGDFCRTFAPRALAVEMECAAALAVARFRGAGLVPLAVVSDRVFPRREEAPRRLLARAREALLPVVRAFLGCPEGA